MNSTANGGFRIGSIQNKQVTYHDNMLNRVFLLLSLLIQPSKTIKHLNVEFNVD